MQPGNSEESKEGAEETKIHKITYKNAIDFLNGYLGTVREKMVFMNIYEYGSLLNNLLSNDPKKCGDALINWVESVLSIPFNEIANDWEYFTKKEREFYIFKIYKVLVKEKKVALKCISYESLSKELDRIENLVKKYANTRTPKSMDFLEECDKIDKSVNAGSFEMAGVAFAKCIQKLYGIEEKFFEGKVANFIPDAELVEEPKDFYKELNSAFINMAGKFDITTPVNSKTLYNNDN